LAWQQGPFGKNPSGQNTIEMTAGCARLRAGSPPWRGSLPRFIRSAAGGAGRRGRGIASLGWGGAVVAGRAGRLPAGVLAVAFWDGGGPAGQKPERVFGWGTGLGGVEGQHEPGLGWEVHRGVGDFDHADDRVAEALDPGVVQLDVVRGPAG